VIHPVRFLRWSRDAGLRDTWYVLSYPLKTWRCRLFGHRWGPEQSDYDPNVGVCMESWRECQRSGCEGWWETFNVYGRPRGKIG
jgi:hypothetical protein